MLVFDSHLDLAWNALSWNRDLTLPIDAIRRAEHNMEDEHRGAGTVCFSEMRKGKVALCLATILARSTSIGEALLDYRTPEIASAVAHGQRTYYRIMEDKRHLRMLTDWQEVENHISQWKAGREAPLGYILSMEGADPILNCDDAERWWELGLRVVGLSHYGVGVYAHGTGCPGGLTPKGFELLKRFDNLGMIVDVTHLMDEGFWQVIDRYRGPVIASHNNCRALVSGERQLTDEQIRALIERGSVIGAALDSWMLWRNYEFRKTDNSMVTLSAFIDHIDHICQIAGNAKHIGIGSDLDGGFGKEQSPMDLETIADLQKIPLLLQDRGYKESDVQNVMHCNWLRFFETAWTNAAFPL